MKNRDLIKKISSEFNSDEIQVSEYLENIFEALAAAFIQNKNVNISEFGRFRVKTKQNKDGEKKKTVLFSPVKKFAHDINYNFNELRPIRIRVIDDKDAADKRSESEHIEDEVEEIVLIDFGEEKISESEKAEEVLIPEAGEEEVIPKEEAVKEEEEILIPEETEEEALIKEETEKEVEVLIPEKTPGEISEEIIPEDIDEIIKQIITKEEISATGEAEEKTEAGEEVTDVTVVQGRIMENLTLISIPEIRFDELEERIRLQETVYKDHKIVSEAITIIKTKEAAEEIPAVVTEEVKTEVIGGDIPDIKTGEEIIEYEEPEEAEIKEIERPADIFHEEEEEEYKGPGEPETKEIERPADIFHEEEEEVSTIGTGLTESVEKEGVPKTSLELEAELLKMLEERKKILEEIRKLEDAEADEIIDIDKKQEINAAEKPNLFEESIIDLSKQNVFVDESGNVFEGLLKDFENQPEIKEGEEKTTEEPVTGEISVSEKEEEIKEDIKEEVSEESEEKEIKEEVIKRDSEPLPEIGEEYSQDKDMNDLVGLFNSIYGGSGEDLAQAETEVSAGAGSEEMKIFDKLLDEQVKEEKLLKEPTEKSDSEKELMTFNELESMFVDFKTEKTEDIKAVKDEEIVLPVKKTDTIKTYDDIFNLVEPNGKNKEKETAEVKKEEPEKRYSLTLKLVIGIMLLIVVIFVSVIFYQNVIRKASEESPQTQLIPSDSTNTSGSDSVIFADTNKIVDASEEEVVYDDSSFVIKYSEKGFFLQFGKFENQFELAKKIKELKDKNITMSYEEVKLGDKQYYRIKAGPYKTLKEAKAIIPKL